MTVASDVVMNPRTRRGQAAIAYADRLGWSVVPLFEPITTSPSAVPTGCACRRPECLADAHKWGKHPRTKNGVKDATMDLAQIRAWWEMWPESNVGIATGPPSGMFVVDVDGPEGARRLAELIGDIHTPHATTGSGAHWVFAWPAQIELRNKVRIHPEIDVRAAGGYIVGAPSMHGSGRLYTWDKGSHPLECPPQPAPPALLAALIGPAQQYAGDLGAVRASDDEHWTTGTRNDSLFRYVASRVGKGLRDHEVRPLAHAENARRCTPPLPDAEVNAIVVSAFDIDRRNHGDRPEPSAPTIVVAGPTTAGERPHADAPRWPAPLEPPAFYGLAGDLVRLLEPHSEADPAAMLFQTLVAIGAILGRHHFYQIEGRPHYPNLFTLVVGPTSTGGKGTAWDRVDSVLSAIDPLFFHEQVVSGLSSGEGLINRLRDKLEPDTPRPTIGAPAAISSAPPDKRLLIVEEEFSNLLTVRGRDGNTISAVLRDLWGGRTLNVLTRKDPLTARDAHGAVIGHITPEELVRLLSAIDRENGFGNRFLFAASRRGAYKAAPTNPAPEALAAIAIRVTRALRHRVGGGALARDRAAEELWAQIHERLAEGLPGKLAGLTKRGRPQVMRLALIYALLDCDVCIRRQHIESAVAVWQYSERSVAYVFGGTVLHPHAAKIMGALPPAPATVTRTDIRDLFDRHADSAAVDECLRLLEAYGHVEVRVEPTGGRPREVIARATKATIATKVGANGEPGGLLSLSTLLSHREQSATTADTNSHAVVHSNGVEPPASMFETADDV